MLAGVGASHIAAGDRHTCAVLVDGSVICWGLNSDGQLGTGETADPARPIAVNLGPGKKGRAHLSFYLMFFESCLHNE